MVLKLLLPVDGSEASKRTKIWLTTLFKPEQIELYLLKVVPKIFDEVPYDHSPEIEGALAKLNESKTFFEAKGYKVVKAEYLLGDPVQGICDYADEMQADQIVLGSQGKSALEKVLFGSVSHGVFEKSKRPLLIYKNN